MVDVSHLLQQIDSGDSCAADQLLPLVYDELRKLAAAKLAREKPGQTLQATALVHEAWLRLVGSGSPGGFSGRRHFFAAAAEAMRRILVDQARRRMTVRHGGEAQRLPELPDVPAPQQFSENEIVIDELLGRLAAQYPRQAEVSKMRMFLELKFTEIAEILGVSPDTVEADWAFARAWLKREWQQR